MNDAMLTDTAQNTEPQHLRQTQCKQKRSRSFLRQAEARISDVWIHIDTTMRKRGMNFANSLVKAC